MTQSDTIALGIFAHVLADLVTALGMKAKNEERLSNGYTIAYDDGAFEEIAAQMRGNAEFLVGMNR